MIDGLKIHFVSIVDNANNMVPSLGTRIWHYQNFVNGLLKDKTCIMGRKTYDITQWKGSKSWVMTRNRNWRKSGVGTLHSIDDIHLFCEDEDIYVLGGKSLFDNFQSYVDTLHLYIINNNEGSIPWIDFDMKKWSPSEYVNNNIWSFARLEKNKKGKTRQKAIR